MRGNFIVTRAKIYLVIIINLLLSCKDKEENYPITPVITFQKIAFTDVPDVNAADILNLSFSFTDGDGDVGFDSSDHNFPYQAAYYYMKGTGKRIPSDQFDRKEVKLSDLISYSERSTPPYDTLPEINYACVNANNYASVFIGNQVSYLYYTPNENFYNIYVEFLAKDANGSFSKYVNSQICLSDYNGRIPLTNVPVAAGVPFKIEMTNAHKGTITFSMTSNVFSFLYKGQTLKLRVSIRDRALHQSNVIETTEFQMYPN